VEVVCEVVSIVKVVLTQRREGECAKKQKVWRLKQTTLGKNIPLSCHAEGVSGTAAATKR